LRFDGFEVNIRSGELRKHGIRIRLQDQPFQVLRLLLENRGEIVTREELKQKLWSADTFVDFDDGLNTAVKRVRDTLGDSTEQPRYIETIPRRGYRFIGVLESEAGTASPSTTVGPTIPPQVVSKRRPLLWLWPAVALGGAIAIVAVSMWTSRSNLRVEAVSVRSIAVLPLNNLSGDPTQDYFAAGLTDALTTELARVGSLRVISRTSAVKYKDKPLAQIARDLSVDAVIEGSVVRSGNRVHITSQLIDARADRHLWAENYDRDLGDILSLEHEIATAVARQVQLTLTPQAQARLAAHPRVNPQAFELYLRATPLLGQINQKDNDTAIRLLEEAVAADPNFALAWAAMAGEYRVRGWEFKSAQQQAQERALLAVTRAIALDPDMPEAYLARAQVLWNKTSHWPHESAIADLKHALALNPNLAEAHHQLANVYNHTGLLEQGQQQIETAVSLDPTSAGRRFRVGINLLYQGRWEDALLWMRSGKEFFPSLWAYQSAFALVQLARPDEARELIRNAVRQDTPEAAGLLEAMEALLAAEAGDVKKADDRIRAAIQRGEQFQHFHHVAYGIASSYALMNRREQALRWLRRAADDGFPCYPLFLNDHNLDNLRQDSQFVRFMAELDQQWKHYAALP
jgi:TolB-like protein/DNA-binding winged helix-turn-helix (wHTH) protein